MPVLIIGQRDVERLLPMTECIALMREAFERTARGEAHFPLRPVVQLPEQRGVLAMMPGYLTNPVTVGIKVITVFPGNLGTPLDAHQGVVLLFDADTGAPTAMMDASSLTAIRTAAATAVATDLLARRTANTLAILGSGVQARTHLEALLVVRDITRVHLWSRTAARARVFADRESAARDVAIDVAASPAEAVAGADIICTTTAAQEPVLEGAWVMEGAHINAIGSAAPFMRELDTAAIVKARLFVDNRESARREPGDLLIPQQEGAIDDEHIVGEIGDLLVGRVTGRRSDRDVTLFKSLGIAVQDLVAARHVLARATAQGVGTEVELGGWR